MEAKTGFSVETVLRGWTWPAKDRGGEERTWEHERGSITIVVHDPFSRSFWAHKASWLNADRTRTGVCVTHIYREEYAPKTWDCGLVFEEWAMIESV